MIICTQANGFLIVRLGILIVCTGVELEQDLKLKVNKVINQIDFNQL